MNKTIKKFALFSLLCIAAAAFAVPAQAQLGIAAGLNYSNFSEAREDAANEGLDNADGYHIGVFYDLSVGPVALRPGVFYRRVGEVEFDPGTLREVDLSSIDVPIDVRLRVPFPIISPYVLAGPVLSWPSSGDEEFGDRLEDMVISANIGAGVEVGLPGIGLRLMPEIVYAFGISDYISEESVAGIDFDEQKTNVLMVRLGLKL
jgi:hypothetical protein